MSMYIDDFGEKIGGARKDMWAGRGLSKADLSEINYREFIDTITKANIWPNPKWEDYIQKGMEPACIYFMRQAREALPSKIKVTGNEERDRNTAEHFIEFTRNFKEHLESILTVESIQDHMDRFLTNYGYISEKRWTTKSSPVWFLDRTFIGKVSFNSHGVKKLVEETIIQNFPYNFMGELKGTEFSRDYRTKDIGLYKKYKRMYPKLSFQTVEEALEFAAGGGVVKYIENAKATGEVPDKKREKKSFTLVRPQLKYISRTGPEFRPRTRNITPDEMIKYFGFRGGEFGLWNNQDDRQACLNYAFDALVDLAYIVGSSTQFISLGGYQDKKLAIAFGARGKGKALAHYEPSRVVINLTKMKGAGALAHEWMHALDDAVGYKCGTRGIGNNFISAVTYSKPTYNHPAVVEAAVELSNAIKRRPQTHAEFVAACTQELERANGNIRSWYTQTNRVAESALGKIEDEVLKARYSAAYSKFSDKCEEKDFEKVCALHKEITGRLPDKSVRDAINQNIRYKSSYSDRLEQFDTTGEMPAAYTVKSDYYINAQKLDSGKPKPYYTEPWELWARAFETYVQTKLPFKSQYLVHSAKNNPFYGEYKPYPEGEDLERITVAMDKFIAICVDTFGERKELPKYQNLSRETEEDNVYDEQLYETGTDEDEEELYAVNDGEDDVLYSGEDIDDEDIDDGDIDEGYSPDVDEDIVAEPELNLSNDKIPADFLIQIYTGLEKSDHIAGAIKTAIDNALANVGKANMIAQEEFTKELPEAEITLLVEKLEYYVVNKSKLQLGSISNELTSKLEEIDNMLVVKTRAVYFNTSEDKSPDITEQDKVSLLTQRKLLQAEMQKTKTDYTQQVQAAIASQKTYSKYQEVEQNIAKNTIAAGKPVTQPEKTDNSLSITSTKELREYLASESRKLIPNKYLQNRKYQYDVLIRRVAQLKLGKVVEGSVPYNKALGISKGWRVEAGKLVISSTATPEKKVEAAIEAVSKLLMKLEIQDPKQQELFIESTVYMVCKKLDIDVRAYMQSEIFEQLVQNKADLAQFVIKSKEIYTKLFAALGLKSVLK